MNSKKQRELPISTKADFKISLTDYQIMRHIQKTCKGYENILADIRK